MNRTFIIVNTFSCFQVFCVQALRNRFLGGELLMRLCNKYEYF